LLPAGRLREPKSAALRADVIIVTKCPSDLKPIDTRIVEGELRPAAYQRLYYSSFEYGDLYPLFDTEVLNMPTPNCSLHFVAGIVNPKPAFDQLALHYNVEATSFFPDHHNFADKDFSNISKTFAKITGDNKFIVTTEKDASRMVSNKKFPAELKPFVFVLPIKVSFMLDEENTLIKKINNYVRKNQRNG
jgi:tetraacyldisaccharide 4'-kinase